MRILGIDPGLQTISFGSGPVLAHLPPEGVTP